MIYTGYYSNYNFYLCQNLTPISISGKAPDWFKGLHWKFLAPSWDIFSKWKNNIITDDDYIQRFVTERLNKIDIKDLKEKLDNINNPILLCYEKQGFCHRHIVADWLNNYGIYCKEY